jgi:hypothetical protein
MLDGVAPAEDGWLLLLEDILFLEFLGFNAKEKRPCLLFTDTTMALSLTRQELSGHPRDEEDV